MHNTVYHWKLHLGLPKQGLFVCWCVYPVQTSQLRDSGWLYSEFVWRVPGGCSCRRKPYISGSQRGRLSPKSANSPRCCARHAPGFKSCVCPGHAFLRDRLGEGITSLQGGLWLLQTELRDDWNLASTRSSEFGSPRHSPCPKLLRVHKLR